MNIYLMGYMGCGKTTIGKQLAQVLGCEFIDFDAFIEAREEASISVLFQERGEIYFRKKEAQYLKELIGLNKDSSIVSLGGGTPCYGINLELIKKGGALSIYLNTSVQELTSRLWEERSKRPLISAQDSKSSLEEFIRKHLFERGFYYNQATKSIKTDGKNSTQIVEEIVGQLF